MVGPMNLQQVQIPVDRIDQSHAPAQKMNPSDPARPQRPEAVGQIVVDVAGREHRFILRPPDTLPQPIFDPALPVPEPRSSILATHSKYLLVDDRGSIPPPALYQKTRRLPAFSHNLIENAQRGTLG